MYILAYLPGPAVGPGIYSIDHTGSQGLNGWGAAPKGWKRRRQTWVWWTWDRACSWGRRTMKLFSIQAQTASFFFSIKNCTVLAPHVVICADRHAHTQTCKHAKTITHRIKECQMFLPLAMSTEASTMGIMLIDASAEGQQDTLSFKVSTTGNTRSKCGNTHSYWFVTASRDEDGPMAMGVSATGWQMNYTGVLFGTFRMTFR